MVWTDIEGADDLTYLITEAQLSRKLRMKVTVTNAYGTITEYTNELGPVTAKEVEEEPEPDPIDTSLPDIPDTTGYTELDVSAGGQFFLDDTLDYVIKADAAVPGQSLRLRGGRNIVWVGGERVCSLADGWGTGETNFGLEIRDEPDTPAGRIVHLEGLYFHGETLGQGFLLNASKAEIRRVNCRIGDPDQPIRYKNCDERDGTNGVAMNHPDTTQAHSGYSGRVYGWANLITHGLTAYSGYQGEFLKQEAESSLGDVTYNRIDLHAASFIGNEEEDGATGIEYHGGAMFWKDASFPDTSQIHFGDSCYMEHNPKSLIQDGNYVSKGRFWNGSEYVLQEASNGDFLDCFQPPSTVTSGSDSTGEYAEYPDSNVAGRIYSGMPPDGEHVPAEKVGVGYTRSGFYSTAPSAVGVGPLVAGDFSSGSPLNISPVTDTHGKDIVILQVVDRQAGTSSPPITVEGFTFLGEGTRDYLHTRFYGRVAGGDAGQDTTDTGYSISWSGISSGSVIMAFPSVWRGAKLENFQVDGSYSSSSPTYIGPAETTPEPNCLVLSGVGANDDTNVVIAAGFDREFTSIADGASYSTSVGSDAAAGQAYRIVANGSTTVTPPTWEQDTSVPWAGVTLVLRPSSTGGGTPEPDEPTVTTDWPELVTYGPADDEWTFNAPTEVSSSGDIENALANIGPSDDVVITVSGTYTGNFHVDQKNFDGATRARIRCADGVTATLNCSGSVRYGLYIHRSSWLVVGSLGGDLKVNGAGRAFSSLAVGLVSGTKGNPSSSSPNPGACNNLIFQNVEVLNSGQALVRIAYDTSNIRFFNMNIHGSGQSNSQFGEGVYVGSASGTQDTTWGIYFEGLEIHDTTTEGMDYKGGTHTLEVDGFYIYDVHLESTSIYSRGALAPRTDGEHVIFRNGFIYGVRKGSSGSNTYCEPVGIYVGGGTVVGENLIIYDCADGAIRCDDGRFEGYHCTLYGNSTGHHNNYDSVNLSNGGSCLLQDSLYSGSIHGSTTRANTGQVTSSDFGTIPTTTQRGDGFILDSGSSQRGTVSTPSVAKDFRGVVRPNNADRGALQSV